MRIISGTCRGRKLATIKGISIRPTSDRVRESIFNIIGQKVHGAQVLDLFAGTGAFGIESLSRGAQRALFVDISRKSCDIIRHNIELCKLSDKSSVFQCDASRSNLPEHIISTQFDLIFIDPPYERGFVGKVLENRALLQCLSPETLLILEHSVKENIPDKLEKLDIHDQRQYGKTLISFFRMSGSEDRHNSDFD
ncbi:MAG: 16S rRNA (guanine(966)-N(2))-methyltransferase RsmD [Desulfamplus sp.]|nr:16S rRNA (guanine(966)-N(2))-methyltransferase RsmD [Desulfamplus sp.]